MDFNSINFFDPVFWIKVITLIAIVFYFIFTFVVYTQVKTMTKIISLPSSEAILKLIAIIHFFLAISLFVYGFVIL